MAFKSNKFNAILCGILSSIIFGFSFLFTQLGLSAVNNNPLEIISFRFAFAAIILFTLKILGILKINFSHKNLTPLIVLSIFYPIIYFFCEAEGIKLTSTSEAGTMIALIPIFVSILATLFLKEKLSKMQYFCIFLSVSGVIFINIMKYQGRGNYAGLIILFIAILSASVYNILSRKLSGDFSSIEITYVMLIAGALFFNFILLIQHISTGTLHMYFSPLTNTKFLLSVLYLSVFSSITAFFMMNYTLSNLPASKAASFGNLSTVVSILAGVMILKESFYWYQFIGILFILFGIWGVNKFE